MYFFTTQTFYPHSNTCSPKPSSDQLKFNPGWTTFTDLFRATADQGWVILCEHYETNQTLEANVQFLRVLNTWQNKHISVGTKTCHEISSLQLKELVN